MRHSVFALFVVSVTACGVFGDTSSDEETPGSSGGPAGPGTPAPPLEGTPTEDQITEKYGVFVAPGAPADADGTRAKPFGTIAAGIERAVAESKRVYVCAGTFKESIKVANGIPMVGGFDCSRPTWPAGGERTRVESPTSPAVIANDISAPTRIEGFDIFAPDGSEATPTSIGLHAKSSPALTFARSKITAGKGKDGAPGTDGVQLSLGPNAAGGGSDSEWQGADTSTLVGGTLKWREGAAGGIGACVGKAGFKPGDGAAGGKGGTHDTETKSPAGGLSGSYWRVYCGGTAVVMGNPVCVTKWNATSGTVVTTQPGNAGTDGTSATEGGTISGEGYTPRDGTTGTDGTTGSGGSGGAGGELVGYVGPPGTTRYGYGATGPGGGAGGCPGLAGTAGKGGGASIGALLVSSKGLTFDATEVLASTGGAGGKGSFGSNPTNGGAPGAVLGTATAAQAGGAGGRAGVSGNGAGGPSYGIAQTLGDAVLTNGAIAKSSTGGAAVAEETKNDAPAGARKIPASIAGDAKDQYNF